MAAGENSIDVKIFWEEETALNSLTMRKLSSRGSWSFGRQPFEWIDSITTLQIAGFHRA